MMKIGFFYKITDENCFQVLVLVHLSFTLRKGNTIKTQKSLTQLLAWQSVRTTRFYCRMFFLIVVKLCSPAAQVMTFIFRLRLSSGDFILSSPITTQFTLCTVDIFMGFAAMLRNY